MSVEFSDIYRTKVKTYRTPSGYIRVDGIPNEESCKAKDEFCISMNENQAKILIASLQDILDSED